MKLVKNLAYKIRQYENEDIITGLMLGCYHATKDTLPVVSGLKVVYIGVSARSARLALLERIKRPEVPASFACISWNRNGLMEDKEFVRLIKSQHQDIVVVLDADVVQMPKGPVAEHLNLILQAMASKTNSPQTYDVVFHENSLWSHVTPCQDYMYENAIRVNTLPWDVGSDSLQANAGVASLMSLFVDHVMMGPQVDTAALRVHANSIPTQQLTSEVFLGLDVMNLNPEVFLNMVEALSGARRVVLHPGVSKWLWNVTYNPYEVA